MTVDTQGRTVAWRLSEVVFADAAGHDVTSIGAYRAIGGYEQLERAPQMEPGRFMSPDEFRRHVDRDRYLNGGSSSLDGVLTPVAFYPDPSTGYIASGRRD